jgi:hypothetical protein
VCDEAVCVSLNIGLALLVLVECGFQLDVILLGSDLELLKLHF